MTELIVVVGLTGVGKTSVIEAAQDKTDLDIEVISYGTKLLSMAKRRGLVDSRDDLTEMPREDYDKLQVETARRIARDVQKSAADKLILDTHAALDTPVGYRPGLSGRDIDEMNPVQFIQIYANALSVRERRESDDSRDRDIPEVSELSEHQERATEMCATYAVLGRAPLTTIENPDGHLDTAAEELVAALEST